MANAVPVIREVCRVKFSLALQNSAKCTKCNESISHETSLILICAASTGCGFHDRGNGKQNALRISTSQLESFSGRETRESGESLCASDIRENDFASKPDCV